MCLNNSVASETVIPQKDLSNDYEGLLNECDYVHLDELKHISNIKFGIAQLNVRSLQSKIINIKNTITELETAGVFLQILSLCETYLNPDKEQLCHLNGYHFECNNRKTKRGGGVGLYIRDTLTYSRRKDLEIFLEGRFETLVVEIEYHKTKFICCSLYRPPNTSLLDFKNTYTDWVDKLKQEHKGILICGDFNIDLLKTENKYSNEFMDYNLSRQLIPSITKPTRITKSSATLIDNIMLSREFSTHYDSYILADELSDHCMCITMIGQSKLRLSRKISKEHIKIREYNSKNVDAVKEELSNVNWSELANLTSNEAFDVFHNKLNIAVDACMPTKEIIVTSKKRIREPWVTSGLRKASVNLSKLYKKSLSSNIDMKLYKEKRQLLQKLKRNARFIYFNEKFYKFKGNSCKVWNLINCILGKKNNKKDFIDMLRERDKTIENQQEISDIFAIHFATIGKKLADKMINTKMDDKDPIQINSLYLRPVIEHDIDKIICNLKPKSSSGYDGHSNVLLKDISTAILLPLSICINKSMREGVFPNSMKLAVVTPLYKANEPYFVTNYRPISLLLTVSKIYEKVFHERLMNFLEMNDIFFNRQFGFRKGHSTETAVQTLVGEVLSNFEKKKKTGALYLDLSKAFDTINHDMLLRRLECMGVRGEAHNWLKSYLSDRSLIVKIKGKTGDVLSKQCNVNSGCPQGSVLGPTLYCCFTNFMYKYLEKCNCICYADDTTIYFSASNVNEITKALEHDILILIKWFSNNLLSLNPAKTQFQIFSMSRVNRTYEINVGNIMIKNSKTVKVLGLLLDETLSWDDHCEDLCKKLSKSKYLLLASKHMMPIDVRKIFYYSHFYSHLTYGIGIWGSMAKQKKLNAIYILQKKIIRVIVNAKYNAHSDPLFKQMNILPLEHVIELELLKFAYKLKHSLLPIPLENLMKTGNKTTSTIVTRNRDMPIIQPHRGSKFNNSFLNKSLMLWQNLKDDSKRKPSISSFCKYEKRRLLKN